MEIVQELERKWGPLFSSEHWAEQLDIPFVSEQAKLNILFNPLQISTIKDRFYKEFQILIPKQLEEFYSKFNGCRLFSDSLCIYGFQVYPDDVFEPYDVIKETQKANFKFKRFNPYYFLVGSLGGQFLFAMDKTCPEKIYVINSDNGKHIQTYNDFWECFSTVFGNLLNEYDSVGKKIHKNKKYTDIPILSNLSFDKIFLK